MSAPVVVLLISAIVLVACLVGYAGWRANRYRRHAHQSRKQRR